MSISTHRWRPGANVKSGYSNLRKHQQQLQKRIAGHHKKTYDKCLIHIKFENSSYFVGASFPIQPIYREMQQVAARMVAAAGRAASFAEHHGGVVDYKQPTFMRGGGGVNQLRSPQDGFDEMSMDNSLEVRLVRKLCAAEYEEATSVLGLLRLNNRAVRFFLVADDPSLRDEALHIMEVVKLYLRTEEWNSCRIVVLAKECDISKDVLTQKQRPVQTTSQGYSATATPQKHKNMVVIGKTPNGEEIEDIMTKDDDSDNNTEEDPQKYTDAGRKVDKRRSRDSEDDQTTSNTTIDEDQEEKLVTKMNSMKYRDSRLITTNRQKQAMNPNIDPIEKCFLALTKMLEDNIFSAAKGISELSQTVANLAKLFAYVSEEP